MWCLLDHFVCVFCVGCCWGWICGRTTPPPGTVLEGGGGPPLVPNGTSHHGWSSLPLGSRSLEPLLVPVGSLCVVFFLCSGVIWGAGSVVGPTHHLERSLEGGGGPPTVPNGTIPHGWSTSTWVGVTYHVVPVGSLCVVFLCRVVLFGAGSGG
jgi:hypothetical protein